MVLSRKKEMGRLGTEAVISDTGSGHKLCERAEGHRGQIKTAGLDHSWGSS